jgi:sporulation protein YlmC with PRC-barrel domain
MQYEVNSLIGCSMAARDGIIGKVEDFYFDDECWTIRYLIVKTGNWLSGRKVLISTNGLTKASWKTGLLPVNLTIEQIQNSPDVDTDKPVFRQHEKTLNDYYSWGNYWEDGYHLGGIWCVTPVLDKEGLIERNKPDEHSHDDQHLRSCNQVSGYHIHASDGEIGHIKDFIVDDKTLQIKFIVVDTHNWFGGKEVLLDVKKITEVEWNNSKVFVDITINSVKNSLEFDESKFIHPQTDKIVHVEHDIRFE